MNPEKYQFKSKNDEIYHKNYIELMEAINFSGGHARFVLKDYENFLLLLANNRISITAKCCEEDNQSSKHSNPSVTAQCFIVKKTL